MFYAFSSSTSHSSSLSLYILKEERDFTPNICFNIDTKEEKKEKKLWREMLVKNIFLALVLFTFFVVVVVFNVMLYSFCFRSIQILTMHFAIKQCHFLGFTHTVALMEFMVIAFIMLKKKNDDDCCNGRRDSFLVNHIG